MRAATGLRLGVRLGGICYHLKHIKIGICLTRKHLPLSLKVLVSCPHAMLFLVPIEFCNLKFQEGDLSPWAQRSCALEMNSWLEARRRSLLCTISCVFCILCVLYFMCSVFYVFCVFWVYLCAVLCTISPRSHTKTPRWRNSLCPPYWRRDIVTFTVKGIFPLLTYYIWSNQV